MKLSGPRYAADPFPTFAAMRAVGPVLRTRLPLVGPVWTTATRDAAEVVLKSDAFVLERRHVAGRSGGGVVGLKWWMPRFIRPLTRGLLGRDDPDHRRLRGMVDHAFRRRDVLAMRETVDARARDMVAALPRECDLLTAFARPFPLAVIADLLGLREGTRPRFLALSAPLGDLSSPFGFLRVMRPLKRLVRLVEEEIAATRHDPRPGIVAELVALDDELTADELLAMVFTLLLAGYETTSHLIANSVATLEAHPDARDWWLADPKARTERAVEELARFASPIHTVKPRYVARDIDVLGTSLRAGEVVMPWLAAANADPAVFDAPDELRLDRFPNPHMVFSTGTHFCLGLQLARIEVRAALCAIYERRFEAAAPVTWKAGLGKRELTALPVRFAQAAKGANSSASAS